ncbi:MAG: carbohydrate-binding domain-containing protein [Firmicutes bacterium]|nr:carbohydrate-binding domain-containing protein [Bacillota bacterium]
MLFGCAHAARNHTRKVVDLMKRFLPCLLALVLLLALSGCKGTEQANDPSAPEQDPGITLIQLSDEAILVNGEKAPTEAGAAVYTANDIVFYLAGQDFTYGEGTEADAHEQSEADAHTVLHISQPGSYSLSGQLSQGQIAIDLGEEAEDDPEAVVTLILDGLDISCSVAPGIIFYNVYECGSKDAESATKDVDTSAAGANVIIADGSSNSVNGSYVARIYESYTLNEEGTEVIDSKKLHKYDAAFYSKQSMNISGGEAGTGTLNINAENEGLDSELHLTINGGNINIVSGNDGINTNEDGVSVTSINGGLLNIVVDGSTGEGDGIDSNGWLLINGGTVLASACDKSQDSGIDADMGIYISGGTVAASGNMMDRISGGEQSYASFSFNGQQSGGLAYSLKDAADEAVLEFSPANSFSCLVLSSPALKEGAYSLWQGEQQYQGSTSQGGMGGFPGGRGPVMGGEMQIPEGELPEGFDPSQMPQPEDMDFSEMPAPDGMKPGERPEMPEGMEFPEGERPEMPAPDGMKPGERPELPEGMEFPEGEMPEGFERPQGGFPGSGGMGQPEELSSEFTLKAGENHFSFVQLPEAE